MKGEEGILDLVLDEREYKNQSKATRPSYFISLCIYLLSS